MKTNMTVDNQDDNQANNHTDNHADNQSNNRADNHAMQKQIMDRLALFSSNAQAVKKGFTWHHDLTKRLAALLYAQEGKSIDGEAIRQCYALMKQKTGVFSTFRGNMALCVATLLSLSPDPHALFDNTLRVYDLLKQARLRASDYLVVAAYLIAARTEHYQYQHVVNRTRDFYDGMKAYHFFHTGQDDYIFSAMLGLSELDTATGVKRIEQLYNRLKGAFWDKNGVQALSQVLVLGGSDDAAAERALTLRSTLKAQKLNMGQSYILPTLGILALLPVPDDTIVRNISETHQALKAEKGFGSFSLTTATRLIFVSAIVAGVYADNLKNGILSATISTSVAALIIAQQAAMIAAVSASTAAAASASS